MQPAGCQQEYIADPVVPQSRHPDLLYEAVAGDAIAEGLLELVGVGEGGAADE